MNPVATSDAAFRGGACPTPEYTIAYTGNYTTSADANRLIDIPTGRANAQSTFWQANLTGSQLIPMLLRQNGSVMLRINGRLEGEALLAGAPLALRTAMRNCVKF